MWLTSRISHVVVSSLLPNQLGDQNRGGVLVMDLFGRLEVQVGWGGGFGPVSMGMICAGGQAGGTGGGRCRLMYGTE
jgi:hypothetical protein